MDSRKLKFAEAINSILLKVEGDKIEVSEILHGLDYRSHGLLIFLISIPFVLPVPIMGLSTIFGGIMMVSAISIITHLDPWLPKRLRKKTIPKSTLEGVVAKAEKLAPKLERFVKPRFLLFAKSRFWIRVHGLMIFIAAAILALPSPPGGNVLPGSATLVLSLGLVEEDGLVLGIGYLLTALNVFLLALILIYGLDWLTSFYSNLF